jgi:hypothetical protein
LVAIIWLHIKIQQGSKDKALPLQAWTGLEGG